MTPSVQQQQSRRGLTVSVPAAGYLEQDLCSLGSLASTAGRVFSFSVTSTLRCMPHTGRRVCLLPHAWDMLARNGAPQGLTD